jgi:hypothetical protein
VSGAAFGGSCSSDERLKKDIESIEGALERVIALRPVHFGWRTDDYPSLHLNSAREAGLIAQEVEQVFPGLVTVDGNGFKKVQYGLELQMQTLAAVKELSLRTDEDVAELKAENKRLKDYICRKDPDAGFCGDGTGD